MEYCKLCDKRLDKSEIWNLKFMGQFCLDCAIYVAAYWEINAHDVLLKLAKQRGDPLEEPKEREKP